MYPILVVGHYCHDTLLNERGTFQALGGSTAYSGALLRALDADYAVVAKVGPDFKYAAQVSRPPLVVAGPTTAFVDDYRQGRRRARLTARCEAIRPADLPPRAGVSVASAVAGELPLESLAALRERSDVLLCDLQGLVRRFDAEGRVSHARLDETPFEALLPEIDFLTTSRDELSALDLARARKTTRIIVTEDRDGCTLLDGAEELKLPAHPAKVLDPTGAGDSFLAGFAYALARGFALERAARFANFCGAKAVSQVGLPKLEPEELRAWLERD